MSGAASWCAGTMQDFTLLKVQSPKNLLPRDEFTAMSTKQDNKQPHKVVQPIARTARKSQIKQRELMETANKGKTAELN